MIRIIIMGIVFAVGVSALDTDGVFIKKTIVSPESAWVFSTVEENDRYLGEKFSRSLAKKIKRMKRFDTVQFDSSVFQPVYEAIHATSTANADLLVTALESHVLDDVEAMLMSNAYQKRRVRAIQQRRGVGFAQTKGKSDAYTMEEMQILMNSVYVYIPYIRSADTVKVEGENPVTVRTITGGMLWYNVQMSPTGSVTLVPVQEVERTSFMALPSSMAIEPLMDAGILRALLSKTIKATKSMPMFTLVSKTTSVSGRDYTLSLTKDSGANLDDLFFLQEDMESDAGGIERKTVGLLRITQSSRDDWAHGYQHIGSVRDRGSYVIESPRRGFQLGAGVHYAGDIQSSRILSYLDNDQIPTLPFDTALGWQASLDYNVGRHIGISQLFVGVDYSRADLQSNSGASTQGDNRIETYHTRLSKKFWWQRHAVRVDVGTGTERVQASDTVRLRNYELKIRSMKYGIGYEFMLSPRWLFAATATQHRMFRLSQLSYTLDGIPYHFSNSDARQLGIQYNRGYMTYQCGLRIDF